MFAGLIDVKDYSKNHTESRKEHLGKVLVGVLSVTVMSIHVQKMVTLWFVFFFPTRNNFNTSTRVSKITTLIYE